ncbi:hypothetical protein EON65_11690 [archaeon]|nr:MAG: hypothetical protein EON65_11690 [archaeon]
MSKASPIREAKTPVAPKNDEDSDSDFSLRMKKRKAQAVEKSRSASKGMWPQTKTTLPLAYSLPQPAFYFIISSPRQEAYQE